MNTQPSVPAIRINMTGFGLHAVTGEKNPSFGLFWRLNIVMISYVFHDVMINSPDQQLRSQVAEGSREAVLYFGMPIVPHIDSLVVFKIWHVQSNTLHQMVILCSGDFGQLFLYVKCCST